MLHEILTNPVILKPQIDYLVFLQNLRTPELDILFLNITKLGESIIPYIFVSLCYWLLDKRTGFILFTALELGMMTKDFLKEIAFVKRPWLLSDRVHPVDAARAHAPGYSFPSGHTVRGITAISGISLATWKNKGLSLFFILLGLSVLFSRNYLGVHTPQDVIVGCLASVIYIFAVSKFFNWIDKKEKGHLIFAGAVLILAISIITIISIGILKEELMSYYAELTFLIGVCIGYYIDKKYIKYEIPKTNFFKKFMIAIVGIACLYLILHLVYFLLAGTAFEIYNRTAVYFCISIFSTAIYPLIIKFIPKSFL